MRKLINIAANLKCPKCEYLCEAMSVVRTTSIHYSSWRKESYACKYCGSKSKLQEGRKFLFLFINVFYGFIIFLVNAAGLSFLEKIGIISDNIFSLIVFFAWAVCIYFPSAHLVFRFYKMELVDPRQASASGSIK